MATDYTDELMEEMGRLQEELDHADAWDMDSQLEQAMDALRCPPPDEPVTHLSGGERRRVALCKLLLSKPDLLLLDEPTNHLDAESVQWLEQHLADYKGAILAVTHDRYFLDNVAEWILELDRGRRLPLRGQLLDLSGEEGRTPRGVRARRTRSCSGGSRRNWPGCAPAPRRARPRTRPGWGATRRWRPRPRRPASSTSRRSRSPSARGWAASSSRSSTSTRATTAGSSSRTCPSPCPRNGIVGVIGPNGVGKTTLFKTIVGLEKPDSGTVRVGDTVKLSYVDQTRGGIDPKKNVWEVVSDGLDYIEVGQNEIPSRAYVSAFGFKGPDQQKPAGVLSGGERNRLNLALTLKEGGNLLLLDEPTNDLDVETLGSLENALEKFPGCAVVISHDRWFLDRTCTHILAWEGDSTNDAKWFWFEGNFGAYEENKIERLGAEAARPHRVTHRRLTRD